MTTPSDPLSLAAWRRTVAEIYVRVRGTSAQAPAPDRETAWRRFRDERDRLFKEHPQTPLDTNQRDAFQALQYFPYDMSARVSGTIIAVDTPETRSTSLPDEGLFRYTKVSRVQFVYKEHKAQLALYWIEGYGGGLFLPFRDATNGDTTYGGGRYLYDTIKGADLGAGPAQITLDFNYAYNPSCAYNERWVCPLAPAENRLDFAVEAGEKRFHNA